MKKLLGNQIVRVGGALVIGVLLGVWLWGGDAPVHDHGEMADDGTIWTCSMHPQIRKSEPGACPICGMDLIPVRENVASGNSKDPFVYRMSAQALAMANIQTSPVVYQRPKMEIALSGKVAVNEQRLRVITAHYAGRIENLFVDFTGQQVQKGDKLATIYSPELMTAQQELLETAKNKSLNRVLYHAARERLRLWKITEKQMDHIEETGEIVTEFDVYADVSGVVLKRTVTEGDHVSRGSALFEIADLREVWILLDAYEDDLSWIQIGSQVDFTVASLPGKVFTSKVTFIDPMINPQTRTASIRAVATNEDLALKLDLFVNAQIRSSASKSALLVPKSAILWTGKRSVVYVDVSEKDTPLFKMQEVVLGPRMGDLYVVEGGIVEGDKVVTQGAFAVDAAAQLSGNYSMMSRPQNKTIVVPKAFQLQLQKVGDHYFDLKNDLVVDAPLDVQKNARLLVAALEAVDMKGLSPEAHDIWMKEQRLLKEAAEEMGGTTDLGVQRAQFEILSKAMKELVERFKFFEKETYIVHCPMAMDNKGAHWLSEVPEVANPYFGQDMLGCGEVQHTFQSSQSQEHGVQKPMQGHQH